MTSAAFSGTSPLRVLLAPLRAATFGGIELGIYFLLFFLVRYNWAWRSIFDYISAAGLLSRPALSLPAKLVSEHVVRKGVCDCEASGGQSAAAPRLHGAACLLRMLRADWWRRVCVCVRACLCVCV